MCGIFGYSGHLESASQIVLAGLKRLEYRGYDSWGIALAQSARISNFKIQNSNEKKKIIVEKHVGAIGDAKINPRLSTLDSNVAIGHTRWATHGGVVEANAHPHFSTKLDFVLAQNGIVENYLDIKKKLVKEGFEFKTETDTEVIVRLIEEKQKKEKSFVEAVRKAFLDLSGRNTILILTKSGEIVAARNGSPLVLGKTSGGDFYLSSDMLSFADKVDQVKVVDNGQLAYLSQKTLKIYDVKNGKKINFEFEAASFEENEVEKEGFAHFMIKEIHEIPEVIKRVCGTDKDALQELVKAIGAARQVYTIGSGTTGLAAAQIAFYLKSISKVNVISLVGADSYEVFDLFGKGDLIIAPSQSGETADVLEVLEVAKSKGVKIATNVNMPGSMMTKLSDFKFMTGAGPEICVMSTKVFVAHICWGYLLAKVVAGEYESGVKNLEALSRAVSLYLKNPKENEKIKNLARKLVLKKDIFLLGKAQNFQVIREGMVKLIEATYKHAHAMPAGDLKHYAITLMEEGVPVIVAVSNDSVCDDVLNAVSQVSARGAKVIGIAPFEHKDFDFLLKVPDLAETSAIMNVIPLQLLAYYMAVKLGNNVDRPRNIAKSVTVK